MRNILEHGKELNTAHWQDFQATLFRRNDNPIDELVRARDSAVLCDLSNYALLGFEGPDAEGFLHGQLSNDIQGLLQDRCQLSTYNSPKGRVLATLLVWRSGGGFLLQLPVAIAEPVRRRLSMFILRSKVQASLASERFICVGIGGPSARAVLTSAGLQPPDTEFGLVRRQAICRGENVANIEVLFQLPGNRYELLFADADSAISTWRLLASQGATPAPAATWRWLTVRCGVAEIGTETQDQFVAQMLNYDLIGGISFTKGCYPGQEIVARSQYRGEIKRRTLLTHASAMDEPTAGLAIFNDGFSDQAVGTVVNAAPSPAGGYDLLACLHTDFSATGSLHLGKPDGPSLELLTLPYALPTRG